MTDEEILADFQAELIELEARIEWVKDAIWRYQHAISERKCRDRDSLAVGDLFT